MCHEDISVLGRSVLVPLPLHCQTMFLQSKEEDVKPISSGSSNCYDILVILQHHIKKVALKVGPTFNPCPSLPSVATDDWKQFECLNIALNNKAGPLFFWNSIVEKNVLAF